MKEKSKNERLRLWQERLERNEAAYSAQLADMDAWEELYLGTDSLRPVTANDRTRSGSSRRAMHVRNIVAENIEAMVSSAIPQPRVRAKRKEDEWRAKIIEDMLRCELDRLPMELLNDQMERTVPIQGGGIWLVEWDNTKRTHDTVGDVVISAVHPKQVIPQDGVYTGIEDMDYIILRLPQTKQYIKRRYGADVNDERETDPEVKDTEGGDADDIVTQYMAFYRNSEGGIGLFSWVCDTVLEDMEDYQARTLIQCDTCGMAASADTKKCRVCGGKSFSEVRQEYQELYEPIKTSRGEIPGAEIYVDEYGATHKKPTRIPFYKPDMFPVVLQKNVSVYGRFLGQSDVEKISDQQNTINRLEMKIIDRIVKAGTRITLPDRPDIRMDSEDGEIIYIANAADKSLIDTVDFKGDLRYEMADMSQVYEEARQILGITDSFQGRTDSTAVSGEAKRFAANQAAGRMESKRMLKNAAYADLFRLIFQFKLAYADEPRPIMAHGENGDAEYEVFNRYDFLDVDETGEYYWNDNFMFSCDVTDTLANNREAMWRESANFLRAGAFGDPSDVDTLIMFWSKMAMLHYPGAEETKSYLEERKRLERQAAEGTPHGAEMTQEELQSELDRVRSEAERDARAAAMRDAGIETVERK